jgi:hypothetical protein
MDIDVEADDARHSVPIAEMGNYLEVLQKQQILRDPFSEDEVTQQLPTTLHTIQ